MRGSPRGSPRPSDRRRSALARELAAISRRLGESGSSRSEPDVVFAWDDLLVVIEVKYRSGNVVRPDYPHFRRYLLDPSLFARSLVEVEAAGYEELVRNWVIGAELARHRRFVFLNLGPERLAPDAALLGPSLAQDGSRRFAHISWGALLGELLAVPNGYSAETRAFIKQRGLTGAWR